MKKYILLLIAVSGIMLADSALAKKRTEFSDNRINWSKELDLNKAQQAKVKEIYAQSHEKIKSLMQQIDTLHREIANIRQNDDEQIRTLLNEKQQVKFDKVQARLNKGNSEFEKDKNGKKPSRKRMRNYGGI